MVSAASLPAIPGLLVEQVIIGAEVVTLVVRMETPTACCPACGAAATHIHSRSRRTLRDLPISGRQVQLSLQTRRFFCSNGACPRRTFTEQVPLLTLPRKQRTLRLQETLRCLGFALGGEAGARLAIRLGMPCSPDTRLRLVRETTLRPVRGPRVLGVDAWAVLKGQTYGTILLDLERRVPIDLLPDREAATFAAWLQAHPGGEWISRDRGETSIQGARLGAPDARQVADRWHLLRNLREALQRFLERQERVLEQVARATDQRVERAPPPLGLPSVERRPRLVVKVRPPPVPKPKPLSPQRERQLEMYRAAARISRARLVGGNHCPPSPDPAADGAQVHGTGPVCGSAPRLTSLPSRTLPCVSGASVGGRRYGSSPALARTRGAWVHRKFASACGR